jgi:hypothetical protein
MTNDSIAEICNNTRDKLLIPVKAKKQLSDVIPCIHNGCISAEECENFKQCKMLELYYKTVITTANEIQFNLLNRKAKYENISGKKSKYAK